MSDQHRPKLSAQSAQRCQVPRWGIPLRSLLVIPVVAQVIVAISVTGWLAYRNGQHAIQTMACQRLSDTGDRLREHLNTYTAIPPLVTQSNADALGLQQLDPNNLRSWASHLLLQSQRFPAVTYLYYGDVNGHYVELHKRSADRLELGIKDSQTGDRAQVYSITANGEIGPLLRTTPYGYDPRDRPWYQAAAANGYPQWTSLYEFPDLEPTWGISFVRPHLTPDGELQGVLGADFTVLEIERFLQGLNTSPRSETFIVQSDGTLVASSVGTASVNENRRQPLRQGLSLLKRTRTWMATQFDELSQIETPQQFTFQDQDGVYWVQIAPYTTDYGLDWLTVSVLPEADFTAQVQANIRSTILFCLLALMVAVVFSIILAQWIRRPIQRLGEASHAIGQDNFSGSMPPSWVKELNVLVDSFNRMGQDLATSRSQLKAYSQKLETLVEQRTHALQQSEEKFAKTFQASPNGITISTVEEGRFIDVNERCAELFGLPRDAILGHTSTELGVWLESNTRAAFHQSVMTGRCRNQELQFRMPSGELKTVLMSSEIIHIQGSPCILSIANDITDRKVAEAQLRQSEARWQLALKGNNDGIWDWNIATHEIFYSPRLKAILGYAEDEMANHRDEWESRLHPDDRERVLQATQAHLRRETPYLVHEYRLRCKEGHYKWILDRGQALWDEAGHPVRIVGSHTDISDRKRVEQALQESRAQFQRLVHDIGEKFVIFSHVGISGIVTYVSGGFESVFGIASEQLINQSWVEGINWLPESLETAQAAVTQLVESPIEFQQFEMGFIHSDGQVRTVLVSQHPVRDNTGSLVAVEGILEDITARQQAEAQLRRSEASLAAAQRVAHVGSWDFNLVTQQIIWSAETFRIFGLASTQNPPSYSRLATMIHPDDRQLWADQIDQTLAQKTPYYGEFRLVRPSGEIRHVESRGEVVVDSDDQVVCLFGVVLDITERKQAEAALRESEERWQLALRGNKDGIWDWDLKTDEVFYSRRDREILGYGDDEFSGQRMLWIMNIHPDDIDAMMASLHEHLSGRSEYYSVEYRLRSQSGHYCWILDRGKALFDHTHHPIRMVGSHTDISDRKAAEETLAQQFQRKQLLASITNQVRQSLDIQEIYQTTADQVGRAFNVSRCTLQIYTELPTPSLSTVAEYLTPDYPSMLAMIVPIVGNPHAQAVLTQDRAIVTHAVAQQPLLAPVQRLCEQLQIQSMLAVRASYQGKPNGIITLNQCDRQRTWTPEEVDLLESVVTQVGIAIAQARLLAQEHAQQQELAQKNADLDLAKQAAERASQVKSKFLANMSHELRTPLNAILGFTQVMQRDLRQDPVRFQQEAIANLGIIQTSGDHLLTLINDILDMAKIEAGRVDLNPHPFDLYTLLTALDGMFRLKAKTKDVALIISHGPAVPQHIKTDEAKLRQVLINLLGNALKFTQVGTVTLRVSLSQQRLQFTVEDTGPGIPQDHLNRLFDPFYQTELGQQSQSGTGLGLAISHTYVRLMGGALHVTSTLGQGCAFSFSLPLTLAQPIAPSVNSTPGSVLKLAPDQPTYRILVVEDKWESRTLLVKLLEPLGFQLREAQNGQEAIAIWENWQPHLIWMDMRMPVMDGYEATQRIRAHVKGNAPAIIALTASALEQEKNVILSAGCNDFVRKPFRDEVIFDKLQEHLGVQYLYDKPITPPPPQRVDQLTTQQLITLPLPWLNQLHEAASLADAEWVSDLIAEIDPAELEVTTALLTLVKTFRCDRIEALAAAAIADLNAPSSIP